MGEKVRNPGAGAFTGYERFVVGLLAFLQFTVVLDFGIVAALGPLLMPALGIGAAQFGVLVSAYALSAGVSAFLTAGFADRFDRKRLLLVFYGGFLFGMLCCGLAPTFPLLLAARVVTGLFAGVVASTVNAVAADVFAYEVRGRVMGFIQAAFAGSQVLGIPIGIFLGNQFGWHGPFRAIAVAGLLAAVAMAVWLGPVAGHLRGRAEVNPLRHLLRVAATPRYLAGFAATMLTATGGYMLAPFAPVFMVHNLGVGREALPLVFMAGGAAGLLAGPLLGRLADSVGKFRVLSVANALQLAFLVWFTHLGPTPFMVVAAAQCALSVLISVRMSSTMAIVSGVPAAADRGAYMAVSAALQQFSGGVAAWVAGMVVVVSASGRIENYPAFGWIVFATTAVAWLQMRRVARLVAGDGGSIPTV